MSSQDKRDKASNADAKPDSRRGRKEAAETERERHTASSSDCRGGKIGGCGKRQRPQKVLL